MCNNQVGTFRKYFTTFSKSPYQSESSPPIRIKAPSKLKDPFKLITRQPPKVHHPILITPPRNSPILAPISRKSYTSSVIIYAIGLTIPEIQDSQASRQSSYPTKTRRKGCSILREL
ncbi:hypothetical protein CEXT_213211 [Caerostris extrusa]|uniref:Uncharacterized protein n=1 Tax=Caerostris extrusa TaxID=172846 RepID=A0AAV4PY88_CAEEX|nr:hypothetical protein CEXT_213211 [Caerostris extrusa]